MSSKHKFLLYLKSSDQESAREILTTISFPDDATGISDALKKIDELLPLMSAIDSVNQAIWGVWEEALPRITKVAEDFEQELSLPDKYKNKSNPWLNRRPKQPLLACLFEPYPDSTPKLRNQLLPMKALLVCAAYRLKVYGTLDFDNLEDVCNKIRYSHRLDNDTSRVFQMFIPPIDGGIDKAWLSAFQWEMAKLMKSHYVRGRANQNIPAPHNWLLSLKKLFNIVNESPETNTRPGSSTYVIQDEDEPEREPKPTAVTRHKQRKPILIFHEPIATEHAAPQATEPETDVIQFIEGSSIADPPVSVQSEQLEIRYTNRRTLMQNHRLPWAWNQLNPLELSVLVREIRESDTSHQLEVQQGALLSWLLLVTGQRLPTVLTYSWISQWSDDTLPEGNWLKPIMPPPNAFKPSSEQEKQLCPHNGSVLLPLPKPFPTILREAIEHKHGLVHTSLTFEKLLGLTEDRADQVLSEFLSNLRGSRQFRLLPGRIRLALSNTIMRITGDKVLQHIIAGLYSDMPPSGIYYTSYTQAQISAAYQAAMCLIFDRASAHDYAG